ncbi:hypothetical protein GCM10011404_32880 [Sphingomonas prati]|nr:hypothetical protein GCM10011404_32880 [Sphingomonas prati]
MTHHTDTEDFERKLAKGRNGISARLLISLLTDDALQKIGTVRNNQNPEETRLALYEINRRRLG